MRVDKSKTIVASLASKQTSIHHLSRDPPESRSRMPACDVCPGPAPPPQLSARDRPSFLAGSRKLRPKSKLSQLSKRRFPIPVRSCCERMRDDECTPEPRPVNAARVVMGSGTTDHKPSGRTAANSYLPKPSPTFVETSCTENTCQTKGHNWSGGMRPLRRALFLRYINRTAELDRKVNRGMRRAAAYDQGSRSRWQANIIRVASRRHLMPSCDADPS